MHMKKLLLAASLAFASTGVVAENYQTELSANYLDYDVVDGFELGVRYHFEEVDTSDKPLAEAAFLDRSSNMTIAYLNLDDFDAAVLSAEFYVKSFYIAPGYINPSEDDDTFGVDIGYVGDGWRVTTSIPEEDYELNVDFKYVAALSAGNFINVEAGYADGGDFSDDTITLVSDYYFDKTFSLGGILVNQDGTDFGVRAQKFFTDRFSVAATFISDEFNDNFFLNATVRF